jgi:outer membrane protein OmpA-like peptidoglycan-associated protein
MFLRDQVDEQYSFADGTSREIEGFYLTWFEGAARRDRDEEAVEVAEKLEESGVEDVDVEGTSEGVALSIRNIHFVPDQAIILADERNRLDGIAEALAATGDRTIKVIGHTADVGTAESQLELSIERAKVIIEEMVKRGIPADRFIYEGRGGTDPIAPNDTEDGRAKNRRVEFIILDG